MKILAFTGAGISKQSNIPTFMERPDVREKLFRSYANTHHEEYNEVIKQLKANMNGAKPNDAHIALAEYHVPIITMNIDGWSDHGRNLWIGDVPSCTSSFLLKV